MFREKAFINGAKFIDTWNGFTDEAGRFSAYGPDMTGQVKRLRADDGVHFTMRCYLNLAHFVEKELRRDLALAKNERNIPLAVLRSNAVSQIEKMLVSMSPAQAVRSFDPELEALRDAEDAINDIRNRGEAEIELAPQPSYIRRKQHELAQRFNLASSSRGREPHRSVRIFREGGGDMPFGRRS